MLQRARQQREDEHGPGHDTASVQRSSLVHEVLRRPGRPLDDGVRTEMETRFGGADFSGVRLHTGWLARASTAEVGARALTSGRHVVIGTGGGDKHTLAHELGHYLQQQQGPVGGTVDDRGLAVSDPGDRWEVAAEEQARQVMRGPAPVQRATESGAARQPAVPAPEAVAVQRMRSDDEDEDEENEEYLGDDESDIAEALEHDDVYQQLVQDVRACTCEPRLQQEGRATREAVVRYPRSQKNERAEQTLRHISIRLFNCIRYLHGVALQNTKGDPSAVDADGDVAMAGSSSAPAKASKGKKKGPPRESEVQGMLINGRLVFATNRNRSITLLMEYLKALTVQQPEGTPAPDLSHLLGPAPSEKELRRGRPSREADDLVALDRRSRLKVQQVYRGQRASATAEAMQRRGPVIQLEAKPTSPEALAELREVLTSDAYKGAVILLKHSTGLGDNPDGTKSMHAEQKLMLALGTADLPMEKLGEKILVRGMKRPCKACWAMLEHYRQRGFPLGFNDEFGAFFQESSVTILEDLPHVATPPTGQGEGNWMSQRITAKAAQEGTRLSAYSGERAPVGAGTGAGGGKQIRVTAREVVTKDERIAYTHAEHGTGGHETASDSDVIEESDGTLTSTFAGLDLSGVRGVAGGDSESEAMRRRPKRSRKENLGARSDLKEMLDNSMGSAFKAVLEERKQKKTNQTLSYPDPLLRTIVDLVREHNVSMNSIATYLGVHPGRLTETVERRTGANLTEQQSDDNAPSSSAPKKRKTVTRTQGGPLDSDGKEALEAAMTSEFRAWWTARREGTDAPKKRPDFGEAMAKVLRGMKGSYSGKSIGDFLGGIPEKTIRNHMGKEED